MARRPDIPAHAVGDFIRDLSPREREEVHAALQEGERVRWATRPLAQAWTFHSRTRFVVGCLVLAASTAFTCAVLGDPRGGRVELWCNVGPLPVSLTLSLLPFWLTGLWMASSPWRQLRQLRQSLYVLTHRRALVFAGRSLPCLPRRLFSWRLVEGMEPIREVGRDDCGNLLFADYAANGARGGAGFHHGFIGLGNLKRASKELYRALKALPQEPHGSSS